MEAHVDVLCSLEGGVDCSLISPASAQCWGCHSHSCCWRHSWLLQCFPQTVVRCLLLLMWQTSLLWDEDAAACGRSRGRRASLHWVLAHKVRPLVELCVEPAGLCGRCKNRLCTPC